MKKQVFLVLMAAALVFAGCQKETSFELGDVPAKGSLQSDVSGDCLPKTVNGIYEEGIELTATTNTITVSVNVTSTGGYVITTDTINGYYFRAVGIFTSLGPTAVTLRGYGTPFVAGTDNFVVSFDGSLCDIAVDVAPAGTTSPAVFTLNGAGGACTGAVVNGTYATATPLGAGNTVTINVNVTTIGTYNVSVVYQGMTFAKSGTFTTTGANTITLVGSGTPTTGGANVVPLVVGTQQCSFTVNVGSPAVFTLDGAPGNCVTPTVAGDYDVDIALTAANTITVPVTVTTAGVYNITMPAVNGITFSGSGTLTTAPGQTITLTASGTPTTPGTNTFPITFGSSSCNFTIDVIGWKFSSTIPPATSAATFRGQTDAADFTTVPPGFPPAAVAFQVDGSNTAGTDGFGLLWVDNDGTISAGDTYPATSNSVIGYQPVGSTDPYLASPSTTGTSGTITITKHDVAKKTIVGTFTGTLKNTAGTTITVTGGVFAAIYP